MQIRNHPPLRGQIGGVAALARFQARRRRWSAGPAGTRRGRRPRRRSGRDRSDRRGPRDVERRRTPRRKRRESWCYAEACARPILSGAALGGAGCWPCRSSRRPSRRRVPPPLQEAGATSFTIFLRGAPIGSEQVALSAHRDRLDDRQLRTSGRADRRRRAAPAGALHARLAAAGVHARRDGARPAADHSHDHRGDDREERRSSSPARRRRRPTPSTRTRCCCCRTASSVLRSARRAVEDGRRRHRASGLSPAADVDQRPRRRVVRRTDSDHGAAGQRAAHAHHVDAAGRASSTPTSGPTTPGG